MGERELGLAGAVAAFVLALALVLGMPAPLSVNLRPAPAGVEFSAGVAGVHIGVRF